MVEQDLAGQLAGQALPLVADIGDGATLSAYGRRLVAEDADALAVVAQAVFADRRESAPPVLVAVADAVTEKIRTERLVRELSMRTVADEAGVGRVSQVSCLLNFAADRVTVETLVGLARWAGLRVDAAANA